MADRGPSTFFDEIFADDDDRVVLPSAGSSTVEPPPDPASYQHLLPPMGPDASYESPDVDVEVGAAENIVPLDAEGNPTNEAQLDRGVDTLGLQANTQLRRPSLTGGADQLDPSNPVIAADADGNKPLVPAFGLGDAGQLEQPAGAGELGPQGATALQGEGTNVAGTGEQAEGGLSEGLAAGYVSPEEQARRQRLIEDAAGLEIPGVSSKQALVESGILNRDRDQRAENLQEFGEQVGREQEARRKLAEIEEKVHQYDLPGLRGEALTAMFNDWENTKLKVAEQQRRIDAAAEEAYQDVDPNRYWNNLGAAKKIGLFIGAFAGGIAQALFGTPNQTLKAVDNAIKRDVMTQARNQRAGERKLGHLKDQRSELFTDHDREQAQRALELKLKYANVRGEIAAAKAKAQGEGAITRLEALEQGLLNEEQKVDLALQKYTWQKQVDRARVNAALEKARLDAMSRGRGGGGAGGVSEDGKIITDPLTGRELPVNTRNLLGEDKTTARQVVKDVREFQPVFNAAQDYHELLAKVHARTFQGGGGQSIVNSDDAAALRAAHSRLATAWKEAANFGAALNPAEAKLMTAAIGGDVPSFTKGSSVEQAQRNLQTFMRGARGGVVSHYNRIGIKYDPSALRLRDVEVAGNKSSSELAREQGEMLTKGDPLEDPDKTIAGLQAGIETIRGSRGRVTTDEGTGLVARTKARLRDRGVLEDNPAEALVAGARRAKAAARRALKSGAANNKVSEVKLQRIMNWADELIEEAKRPSPQRKKIERKRREKEAQKEYEKRTRSGLGRI